MGFKVWHENLWSTTALYPSQSKLVKSTVPLLKHFVVGIRIFIIVIQHNFIIFTYWIHKLHILLTFRHLPMLFILVFFQKFSIMFAQYLLYLNEWWSFWNSAFIWWLEKIIWYRIVKFSWHELDRTTSVLQDGIAGKLIHIWSRNFEKMDEFSHNTVWLMNRKTEISEKFLDEFSRIRQ